MTDDQVIKHTLNYRKTCYMLEKFQKICKCILVLKVSHQRRNVTSSEVIEMQG